MKLLAATVLSLSLVAGAANGQQTTIEGIKAMPTTADIRAVAPALEKYAKDVVRGDLWTRPGLTARDRSIVTVAALIARDQTVELPYYLNVALDNGVKPAELSEIITHWHSTPDGPMRWMPSPRPKMCSRAATSAPTSFRRPPVPSFPRRGGRGAASDPSRRAVRQDHAQPRPVHDGRAVPRSLAQAGARPARPQSHHGQRPHRDRPGRADHLPSEPGDG